MHLSEVLVWTLILLLALPLVALAADDPDEKIDPDKGIVTMVWFYLGTVGMGIVQCDSCSTAAGCKSIWCKVGKSLYCKATPVRGW